MSTSSASHTLAAIGMIGGIALVGFVAFVLGYLRWRRARATIDTRELEQELARGKVIVLDVRSPEEFHGPGGHLPGAIPIPVDQLRARLGELENYRSRPVVPV